MNELLIEFLGGFTKTNQWSVILPRLLVYCAYSARRRDGLAQK